MFDRHISAERALREPQLYQYTLNNRSYRVWFYWVNFLDAIWQSSVIFFVTYLSYQNTASIDVLTFGFTLVFSMMISSLLHVLLQTTRINILIFLSVVLSFLVYLIFTLVFDTVCVKCLPGESPYGVAFRTFRQGQFWFISLFTILTALLPRFTVKSLYNTIANPLK